MDLTNTPILFLDIDDVIYLWKQYDSKIKMHPKWGQIKKFDKKSVKVLNEIIKKSNCEIVISSDWKRGYSLKELQGIFEWNKIIKKPIDCTYNRLDMDKNYEIMSYVNNHNLQKWVAIDDLPLWVNNFVQCRRQNEGIKQTGIKNKVLRYLS
jgi:hypothetical protein